MSAPAPALAVATWVLAAALATIVLTIGDARVALGVERLAPLGVGLAHLLLGAWWCRRALAREHRLAPALAALPAVLLTALVWLPGLDVPVCPPGGGERRAVVLITLDTFRADHLGVVGGPVATPHLDALAAKATLYTHAIASAPLTAPAHASLITGVAPSQHRLLGNGGELAIDTVVTDIARAGWRTGAFLSARVLSRETGLDRGFHHYDDAWTWAQRASFVPALRRLGRMGPRERSGRETVARALDWYDDQAGPTLLWVHLYEPHAPYLAEPHASDLAAARALDADARIRLELVDVEGAHAQEGRVRYAAEIAAVDGLVGALLEGLPDDAFVIVVGDHGESLGEHGYWFNHGALLHDAALRVPLIVRAPGAVAARVESQIGAAAVAGMLREACGVAWPPPAARAGPIEAFTPGQQHRRPPAGANGWRTEPTAAARFDEGKLVATGSDAAIWFDLRADPRELAPLAVPGDHVGEARRVESLARERAPDVDEAMLEALGYVE